MPTRMLLARALPAAAIVAAAALGGFLASRYLVRPPAAALLVPEASAARVSSGVTGEPQAGDVGTASPADEAAPQRTIPDTLPDIAFADRHGVTRRLSDWKGHPLLVNFWAPWCAPCRQEIPLLERLSRERAREGLQVIGVAVDSRAPVLKYARRAAIDYPLLIGERPGLEAVHALGMETVLPFSVFVDAQGRIVTLKIGALRADQARLILNRMDDVDRGRIDLATARRQISAGMERLAIARARQTASAQF